MRGHDGTGSRSGRRDAERRRSVVRGRAVAAILVLAAGLSTGCPPAGPTPEGQLDAVGPAPVDCSEPTQEQFGCDSGDMAWCRKTGDVLRERGCPAEAEPRYRVACDWGDYAACGGLGLVLEALDRKDEAFEAYG